MSPPTTLGRAPFHPSHHNHDRRFLKCLSLGEQAVHTGDPGVGDARGSYTVGGEDRGAFVGHGEVGGAGRDKGHGVGPAGSGLPHHNSVEAFPAGMSVESRPGPARRRRD